MAKTRYGEAVRILGLTLMCVVFGAIHAKANDFVIAERGRGAGCSIVVVAPTTPSVEFAARELAGYVRRLTDVSLPIVTNAAPSGCEIRLSVVDDAVLGSDGFRLKVEGGRLSVTGGRRGVLYGVYEILETYGGCDWFAPWCDVVPSLDRLAVPGNLDFTDKPVFAIREPLWKHNRNGDFAARLRMSGNSHGLTRRHGGVSHVFSSVLPSCHTYRLMLPNDVYFKEHPEYFSEVNGRRKDGENQLCLTNPDVLEIVVSNVLKAIEKEPWAKYFGVSQNDWPYFCTCPKCKAIDDEEGSHAGTTLRFANAVAERIEKSHPDKVIVTLGYRYTRTPPKKTKARHNVMICLCSVECDFGRALDAPDGFSENVAFLRDLQGWSKVAKMLYVWNYTIDVRYSPAPYPAEGSVQGNYRIFRDAGVIGVFDEGEYLGCHSDFAEWKNYLAAKLMWNPEQDVEKLRDRFFQGYYGAAAPYVMACYAAPRALKRTSADAPLTFAPELDIPCRELGLLQSLAPLWDKALEAVKDDPVRSYNVRMGRFGNDFAILAHDLKSIRLSRDKGGADSQARLERRKLARRVLSAMEEAEKSGHHVNFAEDKVRNRQLGERVRMVAEGRETGNGDSACIEESSFMLYHVGANLEVRDDAAASGGRALKLFDNYCSWYTLYYLDDVSFDPHERYRLSVRVRVDANAGADSSAPVLLTGVYDPKVRREVVSRRVLMSEVAPDYRWIEIGDWEPQKGQYIWISPGNFDRKRFSRNPAYSGVWVDQIRIERKGGSDNAAKGGRHPWSHLDFQDDPEDFRFAIVPDRTGGDCRGAFTNALRCCNLMHPAFVMTVGDLIQGHGDEKRTRAQQDELTNFVAKVKAPFFYTVGNHDIFVNVNTNTPNDRTKHTMSTRVWKDYFGEDTYYSFTYKNCLFVVLNGQEGRLDWAHIRNDITPEQYGWMRKTLAEHKDVRWTFLFMHQPDIWGSKEWCAFERDSLLSRKYTVFAGDWHNYFHIRRYDRDYYVLSVAGGCGSHAWRNKEEASKLYGQEYGEFDHITWVTMTSEGPEVVNLRLDGILPGDFLNATNTKDVHHVRTRQFDIPPRTVK